MLSNWQSFDNSGPTGLSFSLWEGISRCCLCRHQFGDTLGHRFDLGAKDWKITIGSRFSGEKVGENISNFLGKSLTLANATF